MSVCFLSKIDGREADFTLSFDRAQLRALDKGKSVTISTAGQISFNETDFGGLVRANEKTNFKCCFDKRRGFWLFDAEGLGPKDLSTLICINLSVDSDDPYFFSLLDYNILQHQFKILLGTNFQEIR